MLSLPMLGSSRVDSVVLRRSSIWKSGSLQQSTPPEVRTSSTHSRKNQHLHLLNFQQSPSRQEHTSPSPSLQTPRRGPPTYPQSLLSHVSRFSILPTLLLQHLCPLISSPFSIHLKHHLLFGWLCISGCCLASTAFWGGFISGARPLDNTLNTHKLSFVLLHPATTYRLR